MYSWTGQPHSVCLFHKGDEILAINDLHAGSVEEVNMYLGKSLKNEVNSPPIRTESTAHWHDEGNKNQKPKPIFQLPPLRWKWPSCVSTGAVLCIRPPASAVADRTPSPAGEASASGWFSNGSSFLWAVGWFCVLTTLATQASFPRAVGGFNESQTQRPASLRNRSNNARPSSSDLQF